MILLFFSETEEGLQEGLNVLSKYCEKWKLVVNVNKTKVMVFRKRGRLMRELRFYYNNNGVEIVSQYMYLGIVFTTGESFKQTFDSLHGQSLKVYLS